MIIVHSAMHEGSIFLWGETSDHKNPVEQRKSSEKEKAKRYVYTCSADRQDLVSVLPEAFQNTAPEEQRFQEMAVWLPTKSGHAIPSSPLIMENPPGRRKARLSLWTITAYRMEWSEAVDFFCSCARKKVIAPGVVIGDDSAYWSETLRFAGSLVARQQYLPSIKTDERDFRAVWLPLYLGDDAESLTLLAKRMPPAARALCDINSAAPPATPAFDRLKAFLAGSVDHLVRSSSRSNGPIPKLRKGTTFESVHDAWLSALKSPDNRISGDKSELNDLAENVRDWSRPITVTALSPLRLCFRLEEPPVLEPPKRGRSKVQAQSWYVRYLLQPRDDLSLLVPVEDTWENGMAKTVGLNVPGPEVREYLLTSLGQASSMCLGIAGSLMGSKPAGYTLDPQEAHDFLTEKALLLRQSGFGVMLPAWWTGKGTKVRLSVSPSARTTKGVYLKSFTKNERIIPKECITLNHLCVRSFKCRTGG